jgi:Putative ATPase subunit of terminase (gpP-like)
MTTRPQVRKMVIARRRQQAADLYLKGWTQTAIAEHLGVRQKTVCTDLQVVRGEWRGSMIRDFDLLREEELKKLAVLEQEAWAAWERSQKPAQEARVKDGDQSKATKTMKTRTGDPRFLEVILRCNANRRALLGLDAPVKVAPTSPDGEQAYHSFVMAELMRLSEKANTGPEVIDAAFIEHASQSPQSEQSDATDLRLSADVENAVQQTSTA